MRFPARVRRALTLLGVLTIASIGTVIVASPAQAAISYRGLFTFNKNWTNQSDSRLTWDVYRQDLDPPKLVFTKTWRAGSGTVKNECTKYDGWLPNGLYSVKFYEDYPGSVVRGRAFWLGAKNCTNGTPRTDLLIHTEAGAGNTQCADVAGVDQGCRWEFPTHNDYQSDGCIKMSPTDIASAKSAFLTYFKAGVTYSNMLQVID